MNRKVGKVSWDSPSLNTNKKEESKKIPFLEMRDFNKSYKVRVVSEEPLQYWCHFTVDANGKSAKVNCTLEDTCPVMVEKTKTPCNGMQADKRYYFKCIDRSDNTIKVLDVGKQIVNAIGMLVSEPDYGPCKEYDITIKKGSKGTNPLYTVLPSPRKPLTAEELQMINNSEDPDHEDFIDLESRIQPLQTESIRKILGLEDKKAPKKQKEEKLAEDEFDVNWEE